MTDLQTLLDSFNDYMYDMDPGCVSEECEQHMRELRVYLERQIAKLEAD